jgi:pimeloyl-ACP methyl ester carboxylesterase
MKGAPYWSQMESFAPTLPYEVTLCNGGAVPVDRLSKITAPTLVLAGGASPPWAAECARTVASSIPGGEQLVLEGQGHGAADDVLIPVLTKFFT